MPEDIEETISETPATITPETRIEEAENTAEIAIDIVDELSGQVAALEVSIAALNDRINMLERELQNERTNAGNERDNTADNRAETEGETSEEPPIIRPKREHPYYRKLW